jgi:hypothetical protein
MLKHKRLKMQLKIYNCCNKSMKPTIYSIINVSKHA